MSLENNIGTFMWNIAEEKDGFKFGKSWKNNSKSLGLVIPILREKETKRNYKMIEEVKNITIEDTGNIDKIRVINKNDECVFIRSGVILAGDTQERATVTAVIIQPNSTEDVEVKCVHASKGIRIGTKMKVNNIAPPTVHSALYTKDQGNVWKSVQKYHSKNIERSTDGFYTLSAMNFSASPSQRMGMSSRIGSTQKRSASSDDLLKTIDEVEKSKQDIEGAIRDIPVVENQVGAIIFDMTGIVGFEVFDSHKSWKALHKKVIAKYSDVLQSEQDEPIFELKEGIVQKKIQSFVEDVLKSEEKSAHSTKDTTTKIIYGNKFVGEYTDFKGDIIHLIVFKANQ